MIAGDIGCPVIGGLLASGVLRAMVETGLVDTDTYLSALLGVPRDGALPVDERGEPDLRSVFAGMDKRLS